MEHGNRELDRRAVLLGCMGLFHAGAAGCGGRPGRRVAARRTRFGFLEIRDEGSLRVLREDGQIHSAVDRAEPTRFVYDYLGVMAAAVTAHGVPAGGRALVVGLGAGSFSRWLLDRGVAVTGVDVNEALVALAREHMGLDPRIDVVIGDGRAFVEAAGPRYDLVVLDAQSEDYVPPHLLTVEWFRAVRARVKEGGLVLMNSWFGAPRADDELATWRAVFPQARVLSAVGSRWGNRILVGAGAESCARLPVGIACEPLPEGVGTPLRDPEGQRGRRDGVR